MDPVTSHGKSCSDRCWLWFGFLKAEKHRWKNNAVGPVKSAQPDYWTISRKTKGETGKKKKKMRLIFWA
jgi:hypothetical protein